jgi:hypothetical protein
MPQVALAPSGQLVYSVHALQRAAQRNLNGEDLDYVYRHGSRFRKTGITYRFLRKRDIPPDDLRDSRRTRLEGAGLLISPNNVVITVVRNEAYLRQLRRKSKQRRSLDARTFARAR